MRLAPLILASLPLLLAAACSKGATPPPPATDAATEQAPVVSLDQRPKPTLSELRVAALTPDDVRPDGLEDAVIDAAVSTHFYGDGTFVRAADDDATACKAEVAVGFVLVKNGAPTKTLDAGKARALVQGEVFCPDGKRIETFRVTTSDERTVKTAVDGVSAVDQLTQAVTVAVTEAAHALVGQVAARSASDAEVLDTLARSEHLGLLMEAASEAGERRLEAALADLVRLTAHDDNLVAIRATAALGLLGRADRDVIRALVKMTSGPDQERHIVAIHALGDIGGDDARRYLENLADSHPTAALRQLARDTVGRLGGPDAPQALDLPPE